MRLATRALLLALLAQLLQPAELLNPSVLGTLRRCQSALPRRALLPRCVAGVEPEAEEPPAAEDPPAAGAEEQSEEPAEPKAKSEKALLKEQIAELERTLTSARGAANAAEEKLKDSGENGYMLLAANFERARAQARTSLKSQGRYGRVAAVRPLVDFIETFDALQAERGADAAADPVHDFYEGIYKQLQEQLGEWKARAFAAKPGDAFDVSQHTMLDSVHDEEVAAGVIISCDRPGWLMGDDVLKSAGCTVSAGPKAVPKPEESAEEGAEPQEGAGKEEAAGAGPADA